VNKNAVDSHFGPNGTFEHASCKGSSAAAELQIASPQLPDQAGQANSATSEELEEQARDVPTVVGADIEADLQELPDSSVCHFFVDTESTDPIVAQVAGGLDPTVSTP
jgi:hypothetical protein